MFEKYSSNFFPSDDFPILGSLVQFLIILVSLSVMNTIIVTATYYRSPSDKIPKILQTILSSKFMTFLWLARVPTENKVTTDEKNQNDKLQTRNDKRSDNNEGENPSCMQEKKTMDEKPMFRKDLDNRDPLEAKPETRAGDEGNWQTVARVVDRVFMVLYVASLIIGIAYYYHRATRDN